MAAKLLDLGETGSLEALEREYPVRVRRQPDGSVYLDFRSLPLTPLPGV